jgi:hypothetical protein
VYGLLVTLCFSRYAFLPISLRQDLPAVLEGLEAAWGFFGGVVRRLVVDNLTPAVTRPDRYTPGLNRVFLEYAQYRGFVVDPAVPDHPRGKATASYYSSPGCLRWREFEYTRHGTQSLLCAFEVHRGHHSRRHRGTSRIHCILSPCRSLAASRAKYPQYYP